MTGVSVKYLAHMIFERNVLKQCYAFGSAFFPLLSPLLERHVRSIDHVCKYKER